MVPMLLSADPWSQDEMQRLAIALRAPRRQEEFPGHAERARFVGAGCVVDFFRRSRSLRWRARPSAAVFPVTTLSPLSAVEAVSAEGATLLGAEVGLQGDGPLRAHHAEPQPAMAFVEAESPAGALTTRAVLQANTSSLHFYWDGTPISNARLDVTIGARQTVEGINLFWNRPLREGPAIRTLTLPQLDAALRCKGLGQSRWVGAPVLLYRAGYPNVRQALLVPLYRVDVRVGREVATVYCTAFLRAAAPLLPTEALSPYLGDVLPL